MENTEETTETTESAGNVESSDTAGTGWTEEQASAAVKVYRESQQMRVMTAGECRI
jgi:hypothetical protein